MTEAPLLAQLPRLVRRGAARSPARVDPTRSAAGVRDPSPRERSSAQDRGSSRSDADRGERLSAHADADPRHVIATCCSQLSDIAQVNQRRRTVVVGLCARPAWIWRRISALLHLGCGTGYYSAVDGGAGRRAAGRSPPWSTTRDARAIAPPKPWLRGRWVRAAASATDHGSMAGRRMRSWSVPVPRILCRPGWTLCGPAGDWCSR